MAKSCSGWDSIPFNICNKEFEIVDYMFKKVKEKLALIYTKVPDKEKEMGNFKQNQTNWGVTS